MSNLKQCKKNISSLRRRHRIIIVGNSHGRDCASKVKCELDNIFEVQGVIKPGADLVTVTKTVKEEVKNVYKDMC
jgi:hypothetical protein